MKLGFQEVYTYWSYCKLCVNMIAVLTLNREKRRKQKLRKLSERATKSWENLSLVSQMLQGCEMNLSRSGNSDNKCLDIISALPWRFWHAYSTTIINPFSNDTKFILTLWSWPWPLYWKNGSLGLSCWFNSLLVSPWGHNSDNNSYL